jgi:hypothetical protein
MQAELGWGSGSSRDGGDLQSHSHDQREING